MKIKSLKAINDAIKKNVAQALILLLALSLIFLNILFYNNTKMIVEKNKDEILSNYALLKSHISEKISIIASSNVFVDFIRSGEITRNTLKSEFVFDIKSLNLKEISGMDIESVNGEKIFSEGSITDYFVNLPLCYFDRVLDSTLGSCTHNLVLYFNMTEIVKNLNEINPNLKICKNCVPIDFLSNPKFGSFKINKSSHMPIYMEIRSFQSLNIIAVNLIVFFFMIALSIWTWRRTNTILSKYLNNPIMRITSKLKSGSDLKKSDEIDELGYLVEQIQERETKLKHAKDNEKLVTIGRMASQLAHDIRSPLAVINSIVLKNDYLPKDEKIVFNNATQLINEIADNILVQYKSELITAENNNITSIQRVSTLLDEIILEKKTQYNQYPIVINYINPSDNNNVCAQVSASDFKRVISNIINNAVESISNTGEVKVEMTASSEEAIITISDNGIGMDQNLIQMILNGEAITCKKEGTGIGCSSALKIIKSWNGQLKINSMPSIGTDVCITIPRLHNEISQSLTQSDFDLILIDNSTSITDAWKLAALHKKKKLVVFHNLHDVACHIDSFDRTIPIYIDSDLGESVRGEEYAKILYDLGFKNIYLTTGYNNANFNQMYWIKEIRGKDVVF